MEDITNKSRHAIVVSSSTSSTEAMSESDENDYEEEIRDETRMWLAKHGQKLFALECSKWLAANQRRNAIKSHR